MSCYNEILTQIYLIFGILGKIGLFQACKGGNLRTVKRLLKMGAIKTDQAFQEAIYKKRKDIAELVFDKNCASYYSYTLFKDTFGEYPDRVPPSLFIYFRKDPQFRRIFIYCTNFITFIVFVLFIYFKFGK